MKELYKQEWTKDLIWVILEQHGTYCDKISRILFVPQVVIAKRLTMLLKAGYISSEKSGIYKNKLFYRATDKGCNLYQYWYEIHSVRKKYANLT